jgi:chromosome segregation ATPase
MSATLLTAADVMAKREHTRATNYLLAVDAVAGGEVIEAADLADVIELAKKSADQFTADVRHTRERLALRASAARYDEYTAELLAARGQVAKYEAELEQFTARISRQIRELNARADELARLVAESKVAGRELLSKYTGPLRDRHAAAQRQADAADARIGQLRRTVRDLEAQLVQVRANPDQHRDGAVDAAEGAVERARAAMATAVAERDAAVAHVAEITAMMRAA